MKNNLYKLFTNFVSLIPSVIILWCAIFVHNRKLIKKIKKKI